MLSVPFVLALVIVSLIASIIIGIGVQLAASEFQLGPLPRAFIGGSIILPSVTLKVFELGMLRIFPLVLVIYYLGTFQIGTKLGHVFGFKAPEENDPPDIFFELVNRGK